jgi:DNA-binding GntR family transcriptional regulator
VSPSTPGRPLDISVVRMTGQVAVTQAGTGLIAERAYDQLRSHIVTLRLPPGAALREEQLMRELQIGRTPLREAVKRLALENLVEVRPRRGTFVTDVQVADIAHIAEVRVELEGQAADLAAARLDDDHRAAARTLLAELEHLRADDGEELMRFDERIHRLVYSAAGNPYLAATLERYFTLSLRIWHVVLHRVPGLSTAVHDQHRLLSAVLAGDRALARALMREHVMAFEQEILEAFEA